MKKPKFSIETVIKIVLVVLAAIHIYPVLLIILSSVKSKAELAVNPYSLPKNLTFENFEQAFVKMKYFRSILNTSVLVIITVFALIVFGSMAAYAIARKKNKFYNFMYLFFISGLIVPFQMRMVPLYKLMLNFKLMNTYHGMSLVYIAVFASFSVFLLVGFVRMIPLELEHAALIDGCGIYRTFFLIIFPLLKPALTTVAVLNTFNVWNDFIMALLFMQERVKMTITVQLSSFQGMYFNNWSLILAGMCLIVLPMLIVYLLAQRFIIDGITAGAVKG